MSSEGTIDYEALTQEAMRSVVRRVLENAIRDGLPGDHHFYISFDTLAPGVILSKRLRDKYAEEMTIVLQHRFWDLVIGEDYFEVKLTFDGIPERLVIPFQSIKVFFDPSVRYGLQFEAVDLSQGGQSPSVVVERGDLDSLSPIQNNLHMPDHAMPTDISEAVKPASLDGQSEQENDAPAVPIIAAAEVSLSTVADKDAADDDAETEEQDGDDTKVVSLDAFRKK